MEELEKTYKQLANSLTEERKELYANKKTLDRLITEIAINNSKIKSEENEESINEMKKKYINQKGINKGDSR